MSTSDLDDLGQRLQRIAAWGDPGEVPEPEELADRYPVAPVPERAPASRRRRMVLAAVAAVVLGVVVGVWALAGRSERGTVADVPDSISTAGGLPWLLPPEGARLTAGIVGLDADGVTPIAATSTFDTASRGSDFTVGRRSPSVPAVEVRDGAAHLPGAADPLPARVASVADTTEFGPVVVTCVLALRSAAGTGEVSSAGPLVALWDVDGVGVWYSVDESENEAPRDCDASGSAAQVAAAVDKLRPVSETEWRRAYELQGVPVFEVPPDGEPTVSRGGG